METVLPQFFVNTLVTGSGLALFAVGFGLVFRTTHFFSLAHGALYTIGAYSTYTFIRILGLPPLLGIGAGILVAALFGGLTAVSVFNPLRRSGASSSVLFLASLGLLVVMQNLISLLFREQTYVISDAAVREGLPILGARITPVQVVGVLVSLSLVAAVWCIRTFTVVGRVVNAVSNDEELSEVQGIPVPWVVLLTFTLSSALVGIAGILAAYDTGLTPLMGFQILLTGITAAMVGGIGSIWGALVGAMLIASVRNFGIYWLGSEWQDAIVFAVLICFLIVRPQGVLGFPLKKATV